MPPLSHRTCVTPRPAGQNPARPTAVLSRSTRPAAPAPHPLPTGTECSFTDSATTKGDPAYTKLVTALAGAKIGTDKAAKYARE